MYILLDYFLPCINTWRTSYSNAQIF